MKTRSLGGDHRCSRRLGLRRATERAGSGCRARGRADDADHDRLDGRRRHPGEVHAGRPESGISGFDLDERSGWHAELRFAFPRSGRVEGQNDRRSSPLAHVEHAGDADGLAGERADGCAARRTAAGRSARRARRIAVPVRRPRARITTTRSKSTRSISSSTRSNPRRPSSRRATKVLAAMQGHVIGKAVMFGLFRRPPA